MMTLHRRIYKMAVIALSGSLIACSSPTSSSPPDLEQTQTSAHAEMILTMGNLLQESYDRGLLNGNVLIAKDGEVLYEKSFGFTSGEQTEKLTAGSVFNTGSIAKEFNAAAIMILVERGQLSLDNAVSDYLSELPSWADDIQIKHLLDYTSGLPPINWSQVKTPADVMGDLMALKGLAFVPGEGYIYSNNNVLLQRLIIEAVTGESFSDFTRTNIIKPSGMVGAVIDPAEGAPKVVQAFNNALENDPYFDIPVKGWVHVTARDMFNWMQLLYRYEIISAASIETLAKSRSPRELGSIMMAKIEEGKLVYHKHHGSSLQWESLIMHDAKQKLSVVILTNKKDRKLFEIMNQLEAINKGEAFQTPKISLYNTLNDECAESDAACLRTYSALKSDNPEIYDFDNKRVLNNLGYRALGRSDTSGAIAIFSKYVSEFPDWGDAYDSLGEAYMLDGQYEASQRNYLRALEIDPANDNAKKMLADVRMKMNE